MPREWQLWAVKYAHLARRAHDNLIFRDVHDGPMPLDYYVWVARSAERVLVIDTGYDQATAARRERPLIRSVREGVQLTGIDPDLVEDVVITHLHYDHVGDFAAFPKARLHLQDREMAYATGRYMTHPRLKAPFDLEHVTAMVGEVYRGRVAFHDGDEELADGISLHRIGGHSDGLQVVRVWTRRGWVVVASDAAHFYANLETGNPFPLVLNVGAMLEGHRRCQALADGSAAHVIPGHDPLVLQRYPPLAPELAGIACRLDVEPTD